MTETMPIKRWTRVEYDRLIEKGVFGPEDRIELLGGALVVREPQGSPHALGIRMSRSDRAAASRRSPRRKRPSRSPTWSRSLRT